MQTAKECWKSYRESLGPRCELILSEIDKSLSGPKKLNAELPDNDCPCGVTRTIYIKISLDSLPMEIQDLEVLAEVMRLLYEAGYKVVLLDRESRVVCNPSKGKMLGISSKE